MLKKFALLLLLLFCLYPTLINARDQIDPGIYTALPELQAELGSQLISRFHRKPHAFCNRCDCSSYRVWAEPFYNSLDEKAPPGEKHELVGFYVNTGGIAIGVDKNISDTASFGIGGVFAGSDIKWHHDRGRGDANGYYGAAYLDGEIGRFYWGASVLAGVDMYDISRELKFAGIDRTANGKFQAVDVVGQIATAYYFGTPSFYIYPYGNLDLLYLQCPNFTESGAESLDLSIHSRMNLTLRPEAGLALQIQDKNYCDTICFSPLISFGWSALYPLHRGLYRSEFAGTTESFATEGWESTWQMLSAHFGFSVRYKCFSIALEYDVDASTDKNSALFDQKADIHFDWKW